MNDIQKDYQRLHRKETDEIVEYAYELEQQLQAYKDKEDKMRELCENVRQHDWEAYDVSLEVLEIIEGDK